MYNFIKLCFVAETSWNTGDSYDHLPIFLSFQLYLMALDSCIISEEMLRNMHEIDQNQIIINEKVENCVHVFLQIIT